MLDPDQLQILRNVEEGRPYRGYKGRELICAFLLVFLEENGFTIKGKGKWELTDKGRAELSGRKGCGAVVVSAGPVFLFGIVPNSALPVIRGLILEVEDNRWVTAHGYGRTFCVAQTPTHWHFFSASRGWSPRGWNWGDWPLRKDLRRQQILDDCMNLAVRRCARCDSTGSVPGGLCDCEHGAERVHRCKRRGFTLSTTKRDVTDTAGER